VPGTQVEFEELTKAFLMLLSSANSVRLNGYITNHLLTKQHVDDRAIKLADESAGEIQENPSNNTGTVHP
jgi:hypothetical protein